MFSKRSIFLAICLIFSAVELLRATLCEPKFRQAAERLWNSWCVAAELNVSFIPQEYHYKACKYHCEKITSCLFYQYQDDPQQCFLCVFNYTDIALNELSDRSQSTVFTQLVMLKLDHEILQAGDYNCTLGPYGGYESVAFNLNFEQLGTSKTFNMQSNESITNNRCLCK